MGINKSKGQMYDWTTHTHCHLGGECMHQCSYCYVNSFRHRVPKYQGKLRLIDKELSVRYGTGKTIFVEHCNDLFAADVPAEFVHQILEHCCAWPENRYVFQTKNPERYFDFFGLLPPKKILGTTMESDRYYPLVMGNAPAPYDRGQAMAQLRTAAPTQNLFVTIEPIMEFSVGAFAAMIGAIRPTFLNIGADSKGNHLIEPTQEKIITFVEILRRTGIEVKEKHNIERLVKR